MSLDGFIADEKGNFDWAEPDEEVHRFVNDRQRPIGTYLYGRRMYETMVYWETEGEDTDFARDYADIWRAADKVVYSRTLDTARSARTRVERDFDPVTVRAMKESSPADIAVGGPHLAAQAFAAGLVDELQIFVAPALVGAGNRALAVQRFARLELLEERRFEAGFVFVRYGVDR